MRIEERKALSEALKEYTGKDCKFISFSLPHRLPALIQRKVGQKWVKTFFKRTQQALRDSGGGELCVVYEEVRKPLTSKGSETHYHALLKGNGLDNLNQEKMLHRWNDLSGRRVKTQKETKLTKVRVPDKTYMKNGEIIRTWKEIPHVDVIAEGSKLVDCGTIDIKDAKDYHTRYMTGFRNLSCSDQLSFWGETPRMQA
jgi:hypothetical protein